MSRRSSMRISPQINNNRETFKTKTQKNCLLESVNITMSVYVRRLICRLLVVWYNFLSPQTGEDSWIVGTIRAAFEYSAIRSWVEF